MNIWSVIYRFACTTLAILLVLAIARVFMPKIRQARELQRHEQQLVQEIEIDKELVQLLKTKSEKLKNDPRFLERVAREELGLAKPGETVFKFIDEPATNAKSPR